MDCIIKVLQYTCIYPTARCVLIALNCRLNCGLESFSSQSKNIVVRLNHFRFLVQFGHTETLRLVRVLRTAVMVRVGGGWEFLENFLKSNDPCRGMHHRYFLKQLFLLIVLSQHDHTPAQPVVEAFPKSAFPSKLYYLVIYLVSGRAHA